MNNNAMAGATHAPATTTPGFTTDNNQPETNDSPSAASRIPKPSRGWYRDPDTGIKLRRVTTILNQGNPKPELMFWSANLTAAEAFATLPTLVAASLRPDKKEAAYDWLRKSHIRKKDERRDIGTAVHDIIEAHVLGAPVPEELLKDPEMAPYLRHFLRFVEEWQITFEASEMTVGNYAEGYAGKLDYLFRSPLIARVLEVDLRTLFIGDTKTGGELDEKGVYPEAGLQMAAYRRSEVGWLRDGSKIPIPSIHGTGIVLHLRPEGYRVMPLKCGDDVFAAFLHVKKVAEFKGGLSKSVVGEALALSATAAPEGKAA